VKEKENKGLIPPLKLGRREGMEMKLENLNLKMTIKEIKIRSTWRGGWG